MRSYSSCAPRPRLLYSLCPRVKLSVPPKASTLLPTNAHHHRQRSAQLQIRSSSQQKKEMLMSVLTRQEVQITFITFSYELSFLKVMKKSRLESHPGNQATRCNTRLCRHHLKTSGSRAHPKMASPHRPSWSRSSPQRSIGSRPSREYYRPSPVPHLQTYSHFGSQCKRIRNVLAQRACTLRRGSLQHQNDMLSLPTKTTLHSACRRHLQSTRRMEL
jgi:hypothetical protein